MLFRGTEVIEVIIVVKRVPIFICVIDLLTWL